MLRIPVLLLALASGPVWADVVTLLDAADRGNISSPDNSVSSFIFAGFVTSPDRDWFEFSIPHLSGPLVSASLELFQPQFGHLGGSLNFSVYALDGRPTHFLDITRGILYGSVSTDSSINGTNLLITLDAAALAAVQASQGASFFIGGIDTGENGNSPAGDLAGEPGRSILRLTTVPEPWLLSPFAMMIPAIFEIRRRLARSCQR